MFLTPSAANQQAYVLSLTDISPRIWTDAWHGTVNVQRYKNKRRLTRPVYTWDMHKLAERLGRRSADGYYTFPTNRAEWYVFWPGSFRDDAGSGVFRPLHALFTVAPFVQPLALGHVYSCSFEFNPLVTQNFTLDPTHRLGTRPSETEAGQGALYQAALFPAMPFIFATTVTDHLHYGPVFASQIDFSVSGRGKLSPVAVSASFTGGKSLRVGSMPVTPFEVETGGILAQPGAPLREINYRTASLLDCAFVDETITTLPELFSLLETRDIPIQTLDASQRLIEMRLSIKQTVTLKATCQGLTSSRSDQHGPRFAEISQRVVEGSLTYFSKEIKPVEPRVNRATMYFGGPFLFPMPNIDWQQPTMIAQAGDGYLHEYKFVARAAPDAIAQSFYRAGAGLPSSEFAVASITEE